MRERDKNRYGSGGNMWTAPASRPSPALRALAKISLDEMGKVSAKELEEIRERPSPFERQVSPENGKNILP